LNLVLAQELLASHFAKYRVLSYSDLAEKIIRGDVDTCETDVAGVLYQFEFQFFWDDEPYQEIRVVGSVFTDPTNLSVRDDFLLLPSGQVVGDQGAN
jgi:hypothetical protein